MKKNYRMTRQRKIIYDLLVKHPIHPTAEELYEKVKRELPNISLGTVYRNLEVLCEQGYAVKVPSVDNKMHFDGNTTSHFHIQCEMCGKIVDVTVEKVDIDREEIEEKSGFRCSGYQIRLDGICPECMENRE